MCLYAYLNTGNYLPINAIAFMQARINSTQLDIVCN